MRKLTIVAMLLTLGACASRNYAQEEHAACESLGVFWGTPEYVQCRGILYQERQANARAHRANNINLYNGLVSGGAFSAPPPRSTTCYTSGQTTMCY